MAIGQIRQGNTQQGFQKVQATPSAFGAILGPALGNLANAVDSFKNSQALIGDAVQQRKDKIAGFQTAQDFIHFQSAQEQLMQERLNNAPADGTGLIDATNEAFTQASDEFLTNVPANLKDEFKLKLVQLQEKQNLRAFAFEHEQGNAFFSQEINNATVDFASAVSEGRATFDDASGQIADIIELSDLPEINKQQLARDTITVLRSAEFTNLTREALMGNAPAGPADGKNSVLPNLIPYERGVLNAIAVNESGGDYGIRFGGAGGSKTFTDFSDHPRISEKRKDGRVSDAAGRYQFLSSTWDAVAEKLGLTDFSPMSQDRAALYLARQDFNRESGGLDFDEELNSGDRIRVARVKDILSPTWEAFKSMSDDKFANIVLGSGGVRGGGTGRSQGPDIWNDPRFVNIPFEDKVALAQSAQKQLGDQLDAVSKIQIEQRKASINNLLTGAALGEITSADVKKMLEQGVLNFQEFNQANNAVNAFKSSRTDSQMVSDVISTGGVFIRSQEKNINNALGQDGRNLLADANVNFLRDVLKPITDTAKFVPSDALEILTSLIKGKDPKKRVVAFDFLSTLPEGALAASTGASPQLIKDVNLFKTLKPFFSANDLMQKFDDLNDPNKRQVFEKLAEEGGVIYDDNITDERLVDTFDPGFFTKLLPGTQRPDLPVTQEQLSVLQKEHRALFIEGYKVTQDEGLANKFADVQIKQRWGTSSIGYSENLIGRDTPPRIVRDGVGVFYQDAQVEGSLDWINTQVRGELGIDESQQFILLSDAQTVSEGAAFKRQGGVDANNNPIGNASYKIAFKSVNGNWEIAKADDQSDLRLNFEHSASLTRAIDDKVTLAQASAKMQEFTARFASVMNVPNSDPEKAALNKEFAAAKQARDMALKNSIHSLDKVGLEEGKMLLQVLEAEAIRLHTFRTNRGPGELSSTTLRKLGLGFAVRSDLDDELYNKLLKAIKARGGNIPEEPK